LIIVSVVIAITALTISLGGYRHGSVEEEYNDSAVSYDSRWSTYINVTIDSLLTLSTGHLSNLPCQQSQKSCDILDVGCGTGALAGNLNKRFPKWRVICSDLSEEMLKVAESRRSLSTALADVESLPFASNSFDLVVTSSSFHFWNNHTKALLEIKRVLRPKGTLLLSDWSHDYISCKICSIYLWLSGHPHSAYTIWSISEARFLLSAVGFDEILPYHYDIPLRPFGLSYAPKWGIMTFFATLP